MIAIWLSVAGGLALLVLGGELLVRGAVQMASRLGVSPLLIGLTLVGFGTSTPELVTSLQAALAGSPGIAYGNIVGSNIANILLILGLSALMAPIAITSSALKRALPYAAGRALSSWRATSHMRHGSGRRSRAGRTARTNPGCDRSRA